MRTPIVMIHGLFGHLNDPRILAPFGDHEVHAPDLLGYGVNRSADTTSLSLDDQARHLHTYLTDRGLTRVHLVGHSVGGAVAVLAAAQQPEAVASLTSVEGNFVPSDAFWSAEVARKTDAEVASMIAAFRRDPGAWIADGGVPISDWSATLAAGWLDNQPSTTIKAQARAVVQATNEPTYLATVRHLIAVGVPINLLAGARSADGWGVPAWVRDEAGNDLTMPDVGHLMMAESPERFAQAVLDVTGERQV